MKRKRFGRLMAKMRIDATRRQRFSNKHRRAA